MIAFQTSSRAASIRIDDLTTSVRNPVLSRSSIFPASDRSDLQNRVFKLFRDGKSLICHMCLPNEKICRHRVDKAGQPSICFNDRPDATQFTPITQKPDQEHGTVCTTPGLPTIDFDRRVFLLDGQKAGRPSFT